MTNISLLPREVLQLVALQMLKKGYGLHLFCRLASACSRLWRLQLPSFPYIYIFCYSLKAEGRVHVLCGTLGNVPHCMAKRTKHHQ